MCFIAVSERICNSKASQRTLWRDRLANYGDRGRELSRRWVYQRQDRQAQEAGLRDDIRRGNISDNAVDRTMLWRDGRSCDAFTSCGSGDGRRSWRAACTDPAHLSSEGQINELVTALRKMLKLSELCVIV